MHNSGETLPQLALRQERMILVQAVLHVLHVFSAVLHTRSGQKVWSIDRLVVVVVLQDLV